MKQIDGLELSTSCRQAASFFCFNVKASSTIRALLSVRASERGARARKGTVGCSPYPAPTRIESNSSARVRIPDGRSQTPAALSHPLFTPCINPRSLSHFPPSTRPSPSRGRVCARARALKRDKAATVAVAAVRSNAKIFNDSRPNEWNADLRLIQSSDRLSPPARVKENKRASRAELSRAR